MRQFHPEPEHPLPPACTRNGEALELAQIAPRVGPLPELRTYCCPDCGHVVTVESEKD